MKNAEGRMKKPIPFDPFDSRFVHLCIFHSGVKLSSIGFLLGCLGAWAAGQAMQAILFEVTSLHVLPWWVSRSSWAW
jgi:hypothetical protein